MVTGTCPPYHHLVSEEAWLCHLPNRISDWKKTLQLIRKITGPSDGMEGQGGTNTGHGWPKSSD